MQSFLLLDYLIGVVFLSQDRAGFGKTVTGIYTIIPSIVGMVDVIRVVAFLVTLRFIVVVN